MARAVTNSRRNVHVKHVHASLHWLPVEHRVQFKIAVCHHVQSANNTRTDQAICVNLFDSIHHHAACGAVAAIACGNIELNLRLLKERFVMQHLQSGTVCPIHHI